MASKRCGCASDACSCVITPGPGINIDGTGTKTNPYIVEATPLGVNLAVNEEGTIVRNGVTLLSFVGGGVTASPGAAAGEVTVTVPVPATLNGITVSRAVFTTVGSTTWTKPGNCLWVDVHVIGGGGGGAGVPATAASQASCGGAGGGGGYTTRVFNAVDLAATEPVTVGGGGAGGAAGSNNGVDGSQSSFGQAGYLMTASPGSGGAFMAVATGNAVSNGGNGGAATGGTVNVQGGDGFNGRVIGGTALCPLPGPGGDSFLSGMQRPTATTTTAVGAVGQNYGGGGGGAHSFASQAASAGGAGAQGIVVVTSYVKV